MTKSKDTGSLAKTIENFTGEKPVVVDENQVGNYLMPALQKMYNLLQPSITTIQSNNLIYFNSNEEQNDNAYPLQLIDSYHNASPTFSNLIDLRRNMLIGNGLQPVIEGDVGVTEFLDRENQFGQSLQDIWQLICFDYSLAETYYLECLYNKKSEGQIAEVVHHDFSTVRAVANENSDLPYINVWQLSRSWGKTNKTGKNKPVAKQGIPVANWNPKQWAKDGARQLLVCKRYSAGNEAYSIPSFNSILPYVELDAQLATFNLNSVSKGFTPTSIVVLSGNPDKKEKDRFVNKFKQRYLGANGEKVLFIWTTSDNDKPKIMPFNTQDNTSMIELLDKILTQKIASGMGANAELAGIQTGGMGLQSDLNKLAVSYNFYYRTHIAPMQQQMIQTLNKVFKVNGLGAVTVVTPPLQLEVPQETPAAVPVNNSK